MEPNGEELLVDGPMAVEGELEEGVILGGANV